MSEVVWEDPPPAASGSQPGFHAFFAELREHPGKWARWPGKSQSHAVVTQLRQGKYSGTTAGEFEATGRRGPDGVAVYVRFVES